MADAVSLYKPRRQFLPFHKRKERWSVLVCHRRAGKTVAIVNDLIERALYTKKPHARYSYIAPFYGQAKQVAWDYLLRYSSPFRRKSNISELMVELPNDSQVRLFGGDNPDSLRGLYHDGVGIDEPAQMKPRLWTEIILPSLADREGWAAFTGTPAGKNEFYSIWDKAQKNVAWFKLMLKASETGLLPQAELERFKTLMDEDEYAQEFECSFEAAIKGSYYGRDMIKALEEGRIGAYPYTEGVEVQTCWDLGFTDDTVIWFFQVISRRPIFFDCYAVSGHNIDEIVQTLHDKRDEYGLTYGNYYLPHDARAMSLQTGKSTIQLLLAHDVRGRIVPKMSIQDGIQATRVMLSVACFNADKCEVGLEAMRQYQREWDEDKKTFRQRPRHDWTSHYADGMRVGALGYQEDYTPPEMILPKMLRPKPKAEDGMNLETLWPTVKQPVGRWNKRI